MLSQPHRAFCGQGAVLIAARNVGSCPGTRRIVIGSAYSLVQAGTAYGRNGWPSVFLRQCYSNRGIGLGSGLMKQGALLPGRPPARQNLYQPVHICWLHEVVLET